MKLRRPGRGAAGYNAGATTMMLLLPLPLPLLLQLLL
eukprot:COSAG01_NODE_54684_length_330_cov_1.025974_1_plen_36_part_01